jgi:hypothetical protein
MAPVAEPATAATETSADADQSIAAAPSKKRKEDKPVLYLEAIQNTWLKKSTAPAETLPADEKVAVPRQRRLGVMKVEEVAADAHKRVTLAAGAGSWVIFGPHFRQEQELVPVEPDIDWHDFNQRISPFLTVGEILQFDQRRRPDPVGGDVVRILKTAREFNRIRQAWGTPLGVTSFYRPEPINRQVGGVPGSRHVTGEAMDIYPIGRGLDEFYRWIRTRWTGGLGDGRNRGFVHLDTRNGGGFVPGAGRTPYAEWDY